MLSGSQYNTVLTMLPGLLHLFALPGTSQAKPVTLISAVPVYTQCKATRLTWEEGVAPYTIKAKVGNDSDPQYRTIHANVTDLTYEFYVDFPGGTDLTLWVQDSSGEVGVKGDPYIQSIVRANPGSDCPLYEFPVTGEATVTRTRTVDQYEATSSGSAERNVRTGQIAGGVVGGVVGLALLLGLLFWNWRMSRRLRRITYDRINHEDQNSDSSGGSIATRTRQSGDACQPHSVVGAAAPSDAGPGRLSVLIAPGPVAGAQCRARAQSRSQGHAASRNDELELATRWQPHPPPVHAVVAADTARPAVEDTVHSLAGCAS